MIEQIKRETKRWDGLSLLIDGQCYGRVEFEPLKGGCVGLHYTIHAPYKGKGWATMLVDAAFEQWPWNPACLLFVDDPRYEKMGGIGYHTDEGRAFADAYRAKRGLNRETTQHPPWRARRWA